MTKKRSGCGRALNKDAMDSLSSFFYHCSKHLVLPLSFATHRFFALNVAARAVQPNFIRHIFHVVECLTRLTFRRLNPLFEILNSSEGGPMLCELRHNNPVLVHNRSTTSNAAKPEAENTGRVQRRTRGGGRQYLMPCGYRIVPRECGAPRRGDPAVHGPSCPSCPEQDISLCCCRRPRLAHSWEGHIESRSFRWILSSTLLKTACIDFHRDRG